MKFKPEAVEGFLALFHKNKEKIRHFEGCQHLELFRSQHDETMFFTYSYWSSEEHLNAYRHSDLFSKVWSSTKAGFSQKAEAWSLDKLVELN